MNPWGLKKAGGETGLREEKREGVVVEKVKSLSSETCIRVLECNLAGERKKKLRRSVL